MTVDYGIVPDQEHYACLIDLLGRAGCFKELMSRMERMPFKPDEHIWNAVLGVSRIHGNVELGKKAAEELIRLDPESSAPYILLSSIHADRGNWDSVEKLRGIMKKRSVNKEKARSWIGIGEKFETFTVSDGWHHPRKEEIYSVLHNLAALMEEEGEASRT